VGEARRAEAEDEELAERIDARVAQNGLGVARRDQDVRVAGAGGRVADQQRLVVVAGAGVDAERVGERAEVAGELARMRVDGRAGFVLFRSRTALTAASTAASLAFQAIGAVAASWITPTSFGRRKWRT